MVRYRRNFVPGGTFFFTLTLADRRLSLLTENVTLLRETMRHIHRLQPWTTDAIAVMPEHLHMLWTLPEGDTKYAQRIRMIKARFTSELRKNGAWSNDTSPWQSRYWEHTIRDERDFENHVAYIHYNPVKHGHALRPIDWPHSSFHRYVREGMLASDWSAGVAIDIGEI
jgi:putative transposase